MDLDHSSGATINGWEHVVQSIETLLSTRLNSRVFRREFGSNVPLLVDSPLNDRGILTLYVAIAVAIDKWEPRFMLTSAKIGATENGVIALILHGNYRPKAHLGDFSSIENKTQSIRIPSNQVKRRN